MALSTIPFSALSSDASNQGVNFRNLIINGDMSIAQRGTSVTGSTSSGYLTVDRWSFARAGSATFSHSQTTDVPTGQGFANSYKIESTTGEGAFGATELNILTQLIEAQNLNSLKWGTSSAESITLSFWVKATVTGTYIVEFYNNDNAGDQLSSSYTINSANTWEKKTITVVGYTSGAFGNDNLTGMQINWWLGAGSAYQSGSLTNTWRTYADANRAVGQVNTFENNNNTFYITGVQLEVGTSASDFEFLPYDVNKRRCERYFLELRSNGQQDFICHTWTSSLGFCPIHFREEMRDTPTFSGGLGGSYLQSTSGKTVSSYSVQTSSKTDFCLNVNGSGYTTDASAIIRASGTDSATFDAEL